MSKHTWRATITAKTEESIEDRDDRNVRRPVSPTVVRIGVVGVLLLLGAVAEAVLGGDWTAGLFVGLAFIAFAALVVPLFRNA